MQKTSRKSRKLTFLRYLYPLWGSRGGWEVMWRKKFFFQKEPNSYLQALAEFGGPLKSHFWDIKTSLSRRGQYKCLMPIQTFVKKTFFSVTKISGSVGKVWPIQGKTFSFQNSLKWVGRTRRPVNQVGVALFAKKLPLVHCEGQRWSWT